MTARLFANLIGIVALAASAAAPVARALAAEPVAIDDDWRFQLGDDPAWSRQEFDDSQWQPVDLPHDWSIAGERTPDAPGGGAFGFFPAGVGWYRRDVEIPAEWRNQSVSIEFEGAYRRTALWCNGAKVGKHDNGFTTFRFDLTPHLAYGASNALAVRVDNSAVPNARWYAGSGLYRHVRLAASPPVRITADGVYARTSSATSDAAEVVVDVEIENSSPASAAVHAQCRLTDEAGRTVAVRSSSRTLAPGDKAALTATFALDDPRLWSPRDPHLYRLDVQLIADDRTMDELTVPCGVRTIAVSADEGFLLNGKPLPLCGGNVHSDLGPLGAAAFSDAEHRRVALLKAAGFNALRTAHNPPSQAFLTACDQLGVLVVEEAFDGWEQSKVAHDHGEDFPQRWAADLDAMIRRDRNHPAVVMWSIGNEMYERGNVRGRHYAEQLATHVRRLDPTRPVTAGVNGLGPDREWAELDPLFQPLDVAGYNYEMSRAEADHARVPGRVIMASETYPGEAFADWHATQRNPYVIGAFVWSALDYLGEAGIGRVFPPGETSRPHWEGNHFPWHGGACGDLDLIGRRRPHSHYRQIVWDQGQTLYGAVRIPPPAEGPWRPTLWAPPQLADHWTWPGHEGRPLTVEAYSRHDEVRVELNGRTVGQLPTTEAHEFKASFEIPYEPGMVTFVGLRDGREIERLQFATAGEPERIELVPERPSILADRQSLAFVNVAVADEAGTVVPHANHAVYYVVEGPAEILAVASADLSTTEFYQANPRKVYHGRALVVLRSTGEPGDVTLTASSPGFVPVATTIQAR